MKSTHKKWGFALGDANNLRHQRKRYQHVGIFVLGDAKVTNEKGIASQWNIGFRKALVIKEFLITIWALMQTIANYRRHLLNNRSSMASLLLVMRFS